MAKGKQRVQQHQAHLPSKGRHSKWRDLRLEVAAALPDVVVGWKDYSDEEKEEIIDEETQKQIDIMDPSGNPVPDPAAMATSSTLPIPTIIDIQAICGQLAHLMTLLTDQVRDLAVEVAKMQTAAAARPTTGGSKTKDTVARPKAWDGKSGSAEARHFLAAYHNWVFAQDNALNVWNATTANWHRSDTKWIQAVLNLMEEDAHTWALPYLEEVQAGRLPFGGSWAQFKRDFTKQFIPLDINESAREALKKLKQGKDSVAEYMSKFDQYTNQTGWSDVDHRQRFYDGLHDKIKDTLSYMDLPSGSLIELREAASKLDRRIRQRKAEKRGHTNTSCHEPKQDFVTIGNSSKTLRFSLAKITNTTQENF